MNKSIIALTFVVATPMICLSQDFSVGGYVSGIYAGIADFNRADYLNGGFLHNRLNFSYNPTYKWEMALELRTRGLGGKAMGVSKATNVFIEADNGLVDMSWNLVDNESFVLNTAIERLYVGYQGDKFSARIGRQRINWSQTMTFNPNDIFNTYSLFDFDYLERSGCDAVRLSYYPTGISTAEFVAKLDAWHRVSAVGFYRANVNNWDIQALGGLFEQDNLIVGAGFSGTVEGVNLRGEASYYHDFITSSKDSFEASRNFIGSGKPLTNIKNTFLLSLGADYIFENSMTASVGILYNSLTDEQKDLSLFTAQDNSKQLSVARWTANASLAYAFSPILDGAITAIYYIDQPILYMGPSINVSIAENLQGSAMVQFFTQKTDDKFNSMCVLYCMMKYSF